MAVYGIRLMNARQLANEYDTLKSFAEHCGISPGVMSRMISRSGDRSRNIGSKAARQIEKSCGKITGWLDINHSTSFTSEVSDEQIAIQFSILFSEIAGLTKNFCSGTMSKEKIMKSLIVLIEAIKSVK